MIKVTWLIGPINSNTFELNFAKLPPAGQPIGSGDTVDQPQINQARQLAKDLISKSEN